MGGDGLKYCDNSSCRFCIKGQCVSSVVKLAAAAPGGKSAVLVCETYKDGWKELDD